MNETQGRILKNVFTIPEGRFPNVDSRDIGKKMRAVINFKVVEKMRGHTILRISSVFLVPQKDMSMRLGGGIV